MKQANDQVMAELARRTIAEEKFQKFVELAPDAMLLIDPNGQIVLANAQAEGVADRVEVHDGDMRNLPFPYASFDVVVASLSVHNIENSEGRDQAVQEMRRVLKPGGRVALMEIFHVKQIADYLRQSGMQDVHVSGPRFLHYPPAWTMVGRKQG